MCGIAGFCNFKRCLLPITKVIVCIIKEYKFTIKGTII
jgi:hypothetical protein